MTTTSSSSETAAFAAGCFWGVQDFFSKIPGVLETTVGYMGGHVEQPSYEDVSTGKTGHAETVQLAFDPAQVSYERLLDAFWHMHDPTSVNRQGPDVGTQYRSVVFYYTSAQQAAAERSKEVLEKTNTYSQPVATEIVPAGTFWRAEEYHQHYADKHPDAPGCHI